MFCIPTPIANAVLLLVVFGADNITTTGVLVNETEATTTGVETGSLIPPITATSTKNVTLEEIDTITATPSASSQPKGPDIRTIFVAILGVTIFLILFSNILVVVTILKHKALRQSNGFILLLSLVLARTAIGAFVVPSGIAMFYSEEALGRYFCKICHYAGWTSAAASVFTIIGIALDKLRSVVHHEKGPLTKSQISLVLVVIWCCAFCYGLRMPIMYDMILVSKPHEPIRYSCAVHSHFAEESRRMVIVDFVLLYAIPLFTIVTTYSHVVADNRRNTPKKKKVPTATLR